MIALEPARGHLRVEEHHGVAALERLVPEWRALAARAPALTPFSLPEWLLPWARTLCDGELVTLTLRADARLLALVPLCHRGDTLALAGGAVSDYRDAVVDPELPGDALAAALHATLLRRRAAALVLGGLRADSPLSAMPAPLDLVEERAVEAPCPFVPLPATIDGLRRLVVPHVTRDVARARRRLTAHDFRLRSAADSPPEPLFDALVALHEARWRERGERGVLADARIQRFHRQVVRAMHAAGALELHALVVDGSTLAVAYGFRRGRTAFYYLTGFDPAWSRLSPGTLVVQVAFERAIECGCARFDFLRGAEPYKYRWGARDAFTEQRTWRP